MNECKEVLPVCAAERAKLQTQQANIEGDLQEIKEVVNRIDHHIAGNGKPGLSELVRNNTKAIADLQKDRQNEKGSRAVWFTRMWNLAVAVFLLILGWQIRELSTKQNIEQCESSQKIERTVDK